jgi:hypothetical protein
MHVRSWIRRILENMPERQEISRRVKPADREHHLFSAACLQLLRQTLVLQGFVALMLQKVRRRLTLVSITFTS